nr:hypothetical protein Iba_chr01aCG7460 [Ipomoea batatas]GMC53113.1 hypothetical protein Iba_chr01dCG3580 [Ipomoea batatas]
MKEVAVVEQVRALVAWRDGGVWPPAVGGCDVSSSCCDKWWLRRYEDGLELGLVMAVRQHGGALQQCMVEIFSGDGNSGGGSHGSDFDWRLLAMVELRWWLLRVTGSTACFPPVVIAAVDAGLVTTKSLVPAAMIR